MASEALSEGLIKKKKKKKYINSGGTCSQALLEYCALYTRSSISGSIPALIEVDYAANKAIVILCVGDYTHKAKPKAQ